MRRLLLIAFSLLLKGTGALSLAKRRLRQNGAIVVLMFHRVLRKSESENASSLAGIVVLDDTFEDLSAYVSRHFQAVDAGTAIPGIPLARLRVCYTFDDGWRDNYTNALPVLNKYAIPATIFMCPGLTGENLPFWTERMVSLLRRNPAKPSALEIEAVVENWKHRSEGARNAYLQQLEQQAATKTARTENYDQLCDWIETAALAKAGIRLGSHTDKHELLTMIPLLQVESELRKSKTAIEALAGSCELFAYPNGDWSPETRQLVADEGFDRAFTTQSGAWRDGNDPLTIPRMNIYDGNLRGLTGKFSSAMFEYTVFWKAWRAMSQTANHITTRDAAAPVISREQTR